MIKYAPGEYMIHEEEVCSILRKARFCLRKTRKKIAKESGLEEFALKIWENGICLPPLKLARKIAKAYSINAQKFAFILRRGLKRTCRRTKR